MPMFLIHRWVCDLCAGKDDEFVNERNSQLLSHPDNARIEIRLPCGWEFVSGQYICPKHDISVEMDTLDYPKTEMVKIKQGNHT